MVKQKQFIHFYKKNIRTGIQKMNKIKYLCIESLK